MVPGETETTPRPSFAGVFGIVRMTGWPAGSAASSCSSDTAAATLMTIVSGARDPLISRARSAIPTGLTPRITTAEPVAACLLLSGSSSPAMAVIPWWRWASSAARSARRTVATMSRRVDAAVDQPAP